jgi:DNA-3-methyladenine glycosylase I
MKEPVRCAWCIKSDLEKQYHDYEWGVPLHDDKKLFEFILLDSFQAGLSWKTVLTKRNNFKVAFANFDPLKISKFTEDDVQALMNNEGIIRNNLKIRGTIKNAIAFLNIQKEFGTFDKYIWSFTDNKVINNQLQINTPIANSKESDKMSKDLKRRGFTFCGTTICYAFMQAAGMVNDHITTCFRYADIVKLK